MIFRQFFRFIGLIGFIGAIGFLGLSVMPGDGLAQLYNRSAAPQVKAVLDYAEKKGETADAFFRQLDRHNGQIVRLDLQIKPWQAEDDPGYSLTAKPGKSRVVCGNGTYGLIDNDKTEYLLKLQHPKHFHAPTAIHIGSRADTPLQALWCGVEDYTEITFTSLHLTGYFIIHSLPVPTANQYTLFPVEAR